LKLTLSKQKELRASRLDQTCLGFCLTFTGNGAKSIWKITGVGAIETCEKLVVVFFLECFCYMGVCSAGQEKWA
jgi:hypothetical protein